VDAGAGDDAGRLVVGVAHRPKAAESVGQGSTQGEAGFKRDLQDHWFGRWRGRSTPEDQRERRRRCAVCASAFRVRKIVGPR